MGCLQSWPRPTQVWQLRRAVRKFFTCWSFGLCSLCLQGGCPHPQGWAFLSCFSTLHILSPPRLSAHPLPSLVYSIPLPEFQAPSHTPDSAWARVGRPSPLERGPSGATTLMRRMGEAVSASLACLPTGSVQTQESKPRPKHLLPSLLRGQAARGSRYAAKSKGFGPQMSGFRSQLSLPSCMILSKLLPLSGFPSSEKCGYTNSAYIHGIVARIT